MEAIIDMREGDVLALTRETLESVLQEAILRELPEVQKGIAMLAVLGAVAPLLGLLGTVTGMIDTFRVITLFGTGDPKLMSGGISEALVNTALGLTTAIVATVLYNYFTTKVDNFNDGVEETSYEILKLLEHKEAS